MCKHIYICSDAFLPEIMVSINNWKIFQTKNISIPENQLLRKFIKKNNIVSALAGSCGCDFYKEKKIDFENSLIPLPDDVAENAKKDYFRRTLGITEFKKYLKKVCESNETDIYVSNGNQNFKEPQKREEITFAFFDDDLFQLKTWSLYHLNKISTQE